MKDPKTIIQVVPSIPFMLEDSDLHVVKRIIRCLSQLYKIAIKVCKQHPGKQTSKQTIEYFMKSLLSITFLTVS